MKRTWLFLLPALSLLSACGSYGLPHDPDFNVNGSYTGRIVGSDQSSSLLDVTIKEQNLQVTATVTSRSTGQSVTLSGTRSVYKASPVTMNLTNEIGSGSSCERGSTERYAVDATFYVKGKYSSEGATGTARHEVCNATTHTFDSIPDGTGSIELVRK